MLFLRKSGLREGLLSGIYEIARWEEGVLELLLQEAITNLGEAAPELDEGIATVLEYMSKVVEVFKKLSALTPRLPQK